MRLKHALIIAALLLLGSVASAQYYTQSGQHWEWRPLLAAGQVEVRNGTNTGWTAAYLSPSGAIVAYGGSAAPSGWLLCDGSAVSRTTYATLFAAIGTTYGVGDGSTTFNIPDLRQRFPLGKATAGTGSTLGDTGGAIDHTHGSPLTTSAPSATIAATNLLTSAAHPTHTHTVTVPGDNPPYLVINYIVKT